MDQNGEPSINNDMKVKLRQNIEENECSSDDDTSWLLVPPHDKKHKSPLKWKNVALFVCLWVAYLLCNMAYSIIGPFFPQEAKDKGTPPIVIGAIVSCAPLCVAVLSPLWGYILPKIGVWPLTFTGLLLVGASFLTLGFVDRIPSTWMFIVACLSLRITEGVGTSMFMTSTFSTLPQLFPNFVATAMGLFEVASGLGYALGPVIGGLIYQLGGFKLPFLTLGVSVLISILPCTILVRRLSVTSEKKMLSLKTVWTLCTNLPIIALILVIVLAYNSLSFYAPILQPFLKQEFNLNPVQVGLVFVISSAPYTLASFFVGPLSEKIGHRIVIITGVSMVTVGYSVISIPFLIGIKNVWVVRASFFIVGIAGAFSSIPVYADMLTVAKRYMTKSDNEEAYAAVVSGIIVSAMNLGSFMFPLIGGMLTSFYSLPLSALIIAEFLLTEVVLLVGVTVIDKYSTR